MLRLIIHTSDVSVASYFQTAAIHLLGPIIHVDIRNYARTFDLGPQYNLSVESNQNVESKRQSVESKMGK